MVREALFPVKLLKTLAKPPVDFDSELWAASPAVGDIGDGVLGARNGRGSVLPTIGGQQTDANHDGEEEREERGRESRKGSPGSEAEL